MSYNKNVIEYAGAWWIKLNRRPEAKTFYNDDWTTEKMLVETNETRVWCQPWKIVVDKISTCWKISFLASRTQWKTWLSPDWNKWLVLNVLDHINSVDYLIKQLDDIYDRVGLR